MIMARMLQEGMADASPSPEGEHMKCIAEAIKASSGETAAAIQLVAESLAAQKTPVVNIPARAPCVYRFEITRDDQGLIKEVVARPV
jgi:hypothetical protein